MKIDILSDLHFDYYFKQIHNSKVDVKKIYDKYFLQDDREIGNILVIAGDLGHSNQQNISILKMMKRIYGYKAIICVLGNHDYCLVNRIMEDDYDDSFARAEEMKKLINEEDGMFCLDGNIVEIDGIKFGGTMAWYSSAFSQTYFPLAGVEGINGMWKVLMPEGKQFKGIKNFDDPYKIELLKIEAVYQKCDVMITHINPSFLAEHISQEYRKNRSTTFYCFNGHEFLKNTTAKHWIFGHTHDSYSYEYEGVECHVNAFELYKTNMKSIEI